MGITHEDFTCPDCGAHMIPIYDKDGNLVGARCSNDRCLICIRFY